MKKTGPWEEIKCLNELCKAGRLFDVQDWIQSGKPVNPRQPEKGNRRRTPLELAVESGFHSLVQILVEAGAVIVDDRYNALEQAVIKRRLDIVMMLVEHGADVNSVAMYNVFETWDPKIMDYFIEHGADMETDYPLAEALSMRIRTGLGVIKRHKHRFSNFQEQSNIALRYHCKKGDLKWVSLMLWAGADPYAKGPDIDDVYSVPDEEEMCALEYAAFYDHFDVFKLKQIKLDPKHPVAQDLLEYACYSNESNLLVLFLEKGFNPRDRKDQGTLLIQRCLWTMIDFWERSPHGYGPMRDFDSHRAREKMKMIHLLAKHGARWEPHEKGNIKDARSSLLKMKPDYTVEFIWIMSQYKASSKECIENLIRTPSIKKVIFDHQARIKELLNSF